MTPISVTSHNAAVPHPSPALESVAPSESAQARVTNASGQAVSAEATAESRWRPRTGSPTTYAKSLPIQM
jgi:hypothetical protein